MPVSWKVTLVQYAGLQRKHHAKTEVWMMDYVDTQRAHAGPDVRQAQAWLPGHGLLGGRSCCPRNLSRTTMCIEYDQAALDDLDRDDF